jgi:hypothetical protein
MMNIAKNMELIFVCALLVAAGTNYAVAVPAKTAAPVAVKATVSADIPTVYVVGKRLTAEEKAKLDA